MEREGKKQYILLNHLSKLPRKILAMQNNSHIAEFVLHELCGSECFNMEKAAYFVDNPDFDFLKGLAGFARPEAFPQNDIWSEPQLFVEHMKSSPFNQKVQSYTTTSFRKKDEQENDVVNSIAQELGFTHHGYYCWDMKHDNHGLFVFEKSCQDDDCDDEHLLNGLSLLSFCPIV